MFQTSNSNIEPYRAQQSSVDGGRALDYLSIKYSTFIEISGNTATFTKLYRTTS